MKKLARLDWVRRTFGDQYVQDYWRCLTWADIQDTVKVFEETYGWKWGMRTDTREGASQGIQLPFIFHGTLERAWEIWDRHGDKLVYIVTKQLPTVRLQGVALRVDPEYVYIEWNQVEKDIAQRHMYRNLENLRRAVFGPGSGLYLWGEWKRVFNPRHASWQRFDEVYKLILSTDVGEITFSVTPEGKVIIW